MDAASTTDTMLADLASLGMRALRVVTRMMEIEQQAADIVASWLPEPGCEPAPQPPYVNGPGIALDQIDTLMAEAVPRTDKLARAHDKLARTVRHDIALQRRIAAGWTGTRSDTRSTMIKRQVARGVGQAIRREQHGEAAERLFDDLYERLDDPRFEAEIATLPVEDIVRRICRELGLAVQAIQAVPPRDPTAAPPCADTG